ncbi:hypothetical protein LLG46_02225 [bacterium]|nr:hypothetical protein [bacterium]
MIMKIANLDELEKLVSETREMLNKLSEKLAEIENFEFEFKACEQDASNKDI